MLAIALAVAFFACWSGCGRAPPSFSSTFVAVAADALSREVFVDKHRRVVGCCIRLIWNGSSP